MKALIIIDIQNGLTKKKTLYQDSLFFSTINLAIVAHRAIDAKIIFFQHNNKQLKCDTFDWEIDERIDWQPTDIVLQKSHGNAFQEVNLIAILTSLRIKTITICGLVSHGCVKATCLGGLASGFETALLINGHTNWNKDAEYKIKQTEIELKKAGVTLE